MTWGAYKTTTHNIKVSDMERLDMFEIPWYVSFVLIIPNCIVENLVEWSLEF